MPVEFLLSVFRENREKTMIIMDGEAYSYGWLEETVTRWMTELEKQRVSRGSVVGLQAEYSPTSIAIMLALTARRNIIVPLARSKSEILQRKLRIAMVEVLASVDDQEEVSIKGIGDCWGHVYYDQLRHTGSPGLVLFTSGTSGEPKAAVHDFARLLDKFRRRRSALRTVNFLMFDHWGGLNTLFHTLSNAGLVVPLRDRNPDSVCATIQEYKVELLPASPTFLNLLVISEAYKRHDLSSLKLITYGTEPMPESTLHMLVRLLPGVRFQQTYGLIEVGVLQSVSRANDSLWVRVGGEGFETRVVDGKLQIKAHSSMLGYLNAASPFTDDGWFMTGDQVDVDGEYIRILGRESELINVGGEKVYPAEVENVIQEIEDVAEVLVYGEKNPLMGSIVCARIRPRSERADRLELTTKVKRHCSQKLEKYKIPVKIELVSEVQFGDRLKKKRFDVNPA